MNPELAKTLSKHAATFNIILTTTLFPNNLRIKKLLPKRNPPMGGVREIHLAPWDENAATHNAALERAALRLAEVLIKTQLTSYVSITQKPATARKDGKVKKPGHLQFKALTPEGKFFLQRLHEWLTAP